ncbi:MAG: hypothetical protein DRP12_02410 [Candidatus Aenigmatarchaeota archaeon]|nr:MAG: hypothetical protein DRP12_02410 [Candidatus Aenigmarchaeota archaeon]
MSMFADITNFLLAIMPWVVVIGGAIVLVKIHRIEKALNGLMMFIMVKEGLTPFGMNKERLKEVIKNGPPENR